jgi:ABC-type nitrate/sulfonate/bicarbonate transport system permease component
MPQRYTNMADFLLGDLDGTDLDLEHPHQGSIVTALGAYVLSGKNVLWNKWFMIMITFTLFFSGGLIPLYLIVKGIGLSNSLWSTILPFTVSSFNLIVMHTSFMAVPDCLEESAKIDGANHFIILIRIVIPLSLPILAVMGLYYAIRNGTAGFTRRFSFRIVIFSRFVKGRKLPRLYGCGINSDTSS